ncbi:MAG TPA: NUDIX hydrolase [Ignavibacteria bacterium]|nr:NUDIX hydrolase [Ignavibacteria bacterium]HMR41302.1 NUDIX hydrolase [Ignavibacteria bacterium]
MTAHSCKLISDVTVISNEKVLLVRYKDGNKYDHQSGWFLPDDLLKYMEDPDDSVKRILTEQLGISGSKLSLLFAESFTGNDQSWHIVFHYKASADIGFKINPSADIIEYKWFDISELPDKKEVAHNGWALYTIGETFKQ